MRDSTGSQHGRKPIKSYDAAIRGAFFDIARVADGADDIARHARYLADGLLFIENGTIQTLLPWQEGEQFLHPHKGYTDLRGRLLLPGFIDAPRPLSANGDDWRLRRTAAGVVNHLHLPG
ncbi:Guanine deaminase [Raoultella terrigena]|uniref:Guanine deaminase n=1 Tax=Raoultella terrigena TaxID=577 RepID=A0A4U9DA64_RAOTE|nr:Guanine deaminase [Raoultella terrigena]